MDRHRKRGVLIILLCAILINGALFWKEDYNHTHVDKDHIVLRIGHVVAEDTPQHQCLLEFKKELESRSNGRFEVRIYPNGVLGGDRQMVESTILGFLHGALPGSAVLAGFVPEYMVSDLPFIFKTRDAAFAAYDHELGDALKELVRPLGIINLGFNQTGYRYITTNNRPIQSPEDLKGLSIRTMENPIHIASFRAWGANPTPMSFSELFTALQQGAIDAQENPILVTYSSRFYEVQNTLSLTGHVFSTGAFLMNEDFYNALDEEDRALLDDCAKTYLMTSRARAEEKEQEFLKMAEEKGMKIVPLTSEQKDAFIEKAKGVYDLYTREYGSQELVDFAMKYNEGGTP